MVQATDVSWVEKFVIEMARRIMGVVLVKWNKKKYCKDKHDMLYNAICTIAEKKHSISVCKC